jgi:hypothetical protein
MEIPENEQHIIQKLYDEINIKSYFEECLKAEKEYSIDMNYKLNDHIIGAKEEFAKKLIE